MRRESTNSDRSLSAPGAARSEPFASTRVSTLLLGGPLMVVALVKLMLYAVARGADARSAAGEAAPAFAFILCFATILGPIVAAMRRRMGPERSLHRKNLATGALVGIAYATACMSVIAKFEGGQITKIEGRRAS